MTQENVGVTLRYASQSAWGTPAATSDNAQELRRVTSNLNATKDTFQSQEVRPDQQVAVMRHGGQRAGGAIEGELSTATYDDFLQALLRGTWAAGVSKSQADFTSMTIAGGVITFGSGDPRTLGFKIGDVVRAGGLSVSANNGVNTRITAMTSTTMTTYPALADNPLDTTCTLAVVGSKLVMGTTKRLFTIEELHPTADLSKVFDSCRIGGASFRIPPNGNASVSFDIQGRRGQLLEGSSSPYFVGTVTAATETDVLTGIEGSLRFAGAESVVVTSLDFNVNNNLSSQPVIGTPYLPDLFYGRSVVTGNTSFFLTDGDLINGFLDEEEIDIVASCYDAQTPAEFLVFNMQRVKLLGAATQIAADGGVIVSSPFQALRKPTTTGYDAGTLSIQRSN